MTISGYPFLHRLWQKIPHPARRAGFANAVLLGARLSLRGGAAISPMVAPYVIAGAFRAPTGLGEAARLTVTALRQAGLPVFTFDTTETLRQECSVSFDGGAPAATGSGTVIVFANPPTAAFVLWAMGKRLLHGKHLIGNFVWEYDHLPKSWRKQAALFDTVASPSHFSARSISLGLERPVLVMPIPLADIQIEGASTAVRPDPIFRILFIGDTSVAGERKNPAAVLDAVERAFGSDPDVEVRMVLRGAQAGSDMARMLQAKASAAGLSLVIDATLQDHTAHAQRFKDADAFVSLHRCEGFGLTLAEAMTCSIPVIASDHSATSEYLSVETGFPIPVTLVPASPMVDLRDPGLWAEPDLAAAADALKQVRRDPALAQHRADRGRAIIQHRYNGITLVESLYKPTWIGLAPIASVVSKT